MTTSVAIAGATGRMGQLATRLIEASDEFELIASLDSSSDLSTLVGADVVLDVTVPAVSQSVVEYAVAQGSNVLVGTSGWTSERLTALERTLAESVGVGVIVVPNFSLASVLATAFSALAAPFFDSIEIVEAHHASKVDSPSGTAIRTAELMGLARADRGPVVAPHVDQRARGQQVSSIPIHSMRLQGVLARQEVFFGGTGELLTITHDTISATSYEAGLMLGLRAARSAVGLTVGLDKLIDLGLSRGATG